MRVLSHIGVLLNKEMQAAIGYFSAWSMLSYMEVAITIEQNENVHAFFTSYLVESRHYSMLAVKDATTGKYSFHS
jgi:hypothetical protein